MGIERVMDRADAESVSSPGTDHRLAAVSFAGFVSFITLYATQPLLPLLTEIFHASKLEASATVTVATVGVALAAPFAGFIADHFGRKRVIVASSGALAVCTLLAATAPNLGWLLAWRFLQGLFTPGVFAVTVAYIQEEWGRGRSGTPTAAYVSGTGVGGFTGRLLTGLMATHFNWRWGFLALGVIIVLSTMALARWLPAERKFSAVSGTDRGLRAAWSHMRNGRLLATYGAGFCVLFSLIGLFTYVTFHLAAPPFYLKPAALGSIFFVYLFGSAVTPMAGRMIDRVGHRTVFCAAAAIGVTGSLLTLAPNLWAVLAGLALASTGVFVGQSAANSYIGVAARSNLALAVGLYVTFYYAGGSAGSFFPGLIWNWGGWPACVVLVVMVQLITAVVALRFWRAPVVPLAVRDAPIEAG